MKRAPSLPTEPEPKPTIADPAEETPRRDSDVPLLFDVVPDPAAYRQELPVGIRRDYEDGLIAGAEVWERLARLVGVEELARFLEGRRAA